MFLFIIGVSLLHLVVAASTHLDVHPKLQTCSALRSRDICPNQQYTLGGDPNELPDNGSFRYESWEQVGLCHHHKGDDFCAFINPSFNRGDGVSIITTRDSIKKIASRPVFNDASTSQDSQASSEAAHPYEVAEIPGKGFGLIATEPIQDEQLVMSRTPAVVVNAKAVGGLDRDRLADLLRDGIESLSVAHRDQYLNLSTHDVAGNYKERIYKIFKTNSFRTGAHDGESDFHSTFTEVSRLNHDCRPNCAYYFDHTTFAHKVIAVRDIMPGEELTIAYFDPLQPSSQRRQRLSKDWGFACTCPRCTADATQVAESDGRIEEIHQLWKELDDYSASSRATPEKAERLVQLYEEEGIYGRLHEAYYRAALEWLGVGDAASAIGHAKRCVHRGLVFRGPDRPFITNMEKLIEDPERGPYWRFRIKSQE